MGFIPRQSEKSRWYYGPIYCVVINTPGENTLAKVSKTLRKMLALKRIQNIV